MKQKPVVTENEKKPGVCYVQSVEGIELPVIDITHPAFKLCEPTQAELDALAAKAAVDQAQFNRVPAFLRKVFLWFFSRQSLLMRELLGASGTYLSGMSTYLLKLGPNNLGKAYSKPMDKVIASSLPTLSTRLRLQDMASMTAKAIAPVLAAKPDAHLQLVNIAGGPCADSLNLLIVLNKENPELLKRRAIYIHVLDAESAAPTFAGRALEALQSPGSPLDGLKAVLKYVPYNWRETQRLGVYLQKLDLAASATVVTAEGGLFDYGTSEEISANIGVLNALTPAHTVLAGTFTPLNRPAQGLAKVGGAATIGRTLEDFASLVEQSGWKIVESRDRMINYVILMSKGPVRR